MNNAERFALVFALICLSLMLFDPDPALYVILVLIAALVARELWAGWLDERGRATMSMVTALTGLVFLVIIVARIVRILA